MPLLPEPISHTVSAIWDAYEKRIYSADNLGIPISQVAEECSRKLWYLFRWSVQREPITPQKQRRFDTGNREEQRLLDDLEAAGIIVRRIDPKTGKQWRVALADGWLRGKLDAKALGILEAPVTEHVVETKIMNEKRFTELKKKGVKKSNPSHYAQSQLYMMAEKLTRCLYLASNTNTDEIYSERIRYDRAFAERIEARVKQIIYTDIAPPRLFEDPNERAAYACQWCPAKPQCHEKQFARKNCRTCIEFSFKPGAIVHCNFWKKDLSYEEQQAGCDQHLFLPSLVPGEQIDASEENRTVTYKLPDEKIWMDGTAS